MATSRLLLPKPRPHLHKTVLPNPKKWISTSSSSSLDGESKKSSHLKKSEVVKETTGTRLAAEPDVHKYTEMPSRSYSKASEVENIVGKSRQTLKGIFTNIKAMMLGNSQNQINKELSNYMIDTTASNVNTGQKPEDTVQSTKDMMNSSEPCSVVEGKSSMDMVSSKNADLNKPESLLFETVKNSLNNEINMSTSAAPNAAEEIFSENLAKKTVSDVIKTDSNADGSKHAAQESMVRLLEIIMDSHRNKKIISASATSPVTVEPDGKKQDQDKSGFQKSSFSAHHSPIKEASRALEIASAIKSTSAGTRNRWPEKNAISEKMFYGGFESFTHLSPGGIQKVKEYMTMMNSRAEGKITSQLSDGIESNKFLDFSNINGKDVLNGADVNDLINCVKELPQVQLVKHSSEEMESDVSPEVSLQMSKEEKNPKLADQKKVLVRFLVQSVEDRDIVSAFKDCGPVVQVLEVPAVQKSKFKDAYIYFETREGAQSALDRTDMLVRNSDVLVEASFPLKAAPNKISVPDLIGCPDVPVALVKNPIRTVMVKKLTHDISSRQLKEALAFCGSKITAVFFGSSNSVAFVEFETEDAKKRAVAEHSIFVSGKQLLVYRIDAPRTTVVRISNVNPKGLWRVRSLTEPFGQVKHVSYRSKSIVDVRYTLQEWPNMLNILNRLNGRKVDGRQWVVGPAPWFPPEILRILWSRADEQGCVKSAMRNLLHGIEEKPLGMTGLTDLVAKYYRDEI